MREDLVSYLITDPTYYSSQPKTFEENLRKVLETKKVTMACFRDKESENYEELAKVFIKICKEFNIKKILLNQKIKLAKKLGAHGVHLTSKQFNKIKKAKDLELFTVISCHTYEDIEKAQESYVNAVTYSPVFKTPNKPEPKGIEKFRHAVRVYEDMDIIALGGIISQKEVEKISTTRAYGFASIRYFI